MACGHHRTVLAKADLLDAGLQYEVIRGEALARPQGLGFVELVEEGLDLGDLRHRNGGEPMGLEILGDPRLVVAAMGLEVELPGKGFALRLAGALGARHHVVGTGELGPHGAGGEHVAGEERGHDAGGCCKAHANGRIHGHDGDMPGADATTLRRRPSPKAQHSNHAQGHPCGTGDAHPPRRRRSRSAVDRPIARASAR